MWSGDGVGNGVSELEILNDAHVLHAGCTGIAGLHGSYFTKRGVNAGVEDEAVAEVVRTDDGRDADGIERRAGKNVVVTFVAVLIRVGITAGSGVGWNRSVGEE